MKKFLKSSERKKSDMQKKTFSFHLSREKIKEFKDISTEAKLNWLEDANNFINKFLSPENRKKWEKMISGGGL